MGERRPRVSGELGERVDGVRGDVPFDRWVRRALEAALESAPADPPGSASPRTSGPSFLPADVPERLSERDLVSLGRHPKAGVVPRPKGGG